MNRRVIKAGYSSWNRWLINPMQRRGIGLNRWTNDFSCPDWSVTRGGDSAYERGGDARRKFWINPLKETDLGVAQASFEP